MPAGLRPVIPSESLPENFAAFPFGFACFSVSDAGRPSAVRHSRVPAGLGVVPAYGVKSAAHW